MRLQHLAQRAGHTAERGGILAQMAFEAFGCTRTLARARLETFAPWAGTVRGVARETMFVHRIGLLHKAAEGQDRLEVIGPSLRA